MLATLFALIALCVPMAVHARCVGDDDPVITQAELEIGRNPAEAIKWIDHAIARNKSGDPRRLANLYLAQTIAYSMSGRKNGDIFKAAEQSAKEFPANDPINLFLRISRAARLDDKDERKKANDAIAYDIQDLPATAGTSICLAADLGISYADDGDLRTAFDLTSRAYRNSIGTAPTRAHAEVTSNLAFLVSIGQDLEYARRLHSEALRFHRANGLTDLAADEHLLRGYTELEADNIDKALADFDASAEQGKSYGNDYAVAYAKLGTCLAAIEGNLIARARPACNTAYVALSGDREPMAYASGIAMAMLFVKEDRPREALKTIDTVFERKLKPSGPQDEIDAYKTRAQALAALGRYAEAYLAMVRSAEIASDDFKNTQANATSVAHARFQARQLRSELAEEQRAAQESRNLAFTVIIVSATGLVLLGMLVFMLLRHRSKFRRLAMIDPLTNLSNRRAALDQAGFMLAASDFAPRATLALLDIDRFKRCNDQYGHDAGDHILREFAKTVKRCVRPDDIVGRWGGEEFLIIFAATGAENAEAVIERIRRDAEDQLFETAPEFTLRFSAGVAEIEETDEDIEACIRLADRRMYQAKAMGRNRTCSRGPGIDPLASISERLQPVAPRGLRDERDTDEFSRTPSA